MPAAKKTSPAKILPKQNLGGQATKKRAVKKTTDKVEKTEAPIGLKLRIKLRAYDHKIIDNSARQITKQRFGIGLLRHAKRQPVRNVAVV